MGVEHTATVTKNNYLDRPKKVEAMQVCLHFINKVDKPGHPSNTFPLDIVSKPEVYVSEKHKP